MHQRMAYPRASNANWNVRELTKKFEVNATVTQEPVIRCDRNKPTENKVNIHRTHAFRLKSQDGENGLPLQPSKAAYVFGKRVRKVDDNQSVKSIVERFDTSHVVPTPEKVFKDEYSKVLKKSPSCAFDGRTAVSPKMNTLRKTISNITESTNCSYGGTSAEKRQGAELPPVRHEPLQELVDKMNSNNNNSVSSSELTNSLKAALRSPLPKGPPPKKPPRTFAHQKEHEEREATMTESRRKLVKLREIVDGSRQSGGGAVLVARSPALPRRTREQAAGADADSRPRGLQGSGGRGLAVLRLCAACLSGDGGTVRRADYQELCRAAAAPQEHIYDVPFQPRAKPDTAQCRCCNEPGLHYLCSDVVHNLDNARTSPLNTHKSRTEPC
ncbi:uncharacterized protein LOC134540394 isoform X2 [Bacillus rossius redtenbacheri]|uniref:uncharacterized protein LOC134540394 isoform X2 n=1 Tax=Bacillus rossius redtenbacheri TaxID=93214 RepID=UPI002FDE4BE9